MSEPTTKKPPRTAATTITDPWAPEGDEYPRPARYLLERGWTPDGHPGDSRTRWTDPRAPVSDEEKLVKVGEVTKDNGEVVDVEQTHITCRAWPMSLEEAVRIQQLREQPGK